MICTGPIRSNYRQRSRAPKKPPHAPLPLVSPKRFGIGAFVPLAHFCCWAAPGLSPVSLDKGKTILLIAISFLEPPLEAGVCVAQKGARVHRMRPFSWIPTRKHRVQPLPALAALRERLVQLRAWIRRAPPAVLHAAPHGALPNRATLAHHAGPLLRAPTAKTAHLLRPQRPLGRGTGPRQAALRRLIARRPKHRAVPAVIPATGPIHVTSPPSATAMPARRTDPEFHSARTSRRAPSQTRIRPR